MDDSDGEYGDSYASSSRASEANFSDADYSSLNEAEPTRRKVRTCSSSANIARWMISCISSFEYKVPLCKSHLSGK